jgi:hypothetical protein
LNPIKIFRDPLLIKRDSAKEKTFLGRAGLGESYENISRHKQKSKKNPKAFLFVHQRTQPQGNRAAPEKRYGGCILLF